MGIPNKNLFFQNHEIENLNKQFEQDYCQILKTLKEADELNRDEMYRINTHSFEKAALASQAQRAFNKNHSHHNQNSFVSVKVTGRPPFHSQPLENRIQLDNNNDFEDEFSDIASIPSITFSGREECSSPVKRCHNTAPHPAYTQITRNSFINDNKIINQSISSGSTSELLKRSPYYPMNDSINTTENQFCSVHVSGGGNNKQPNGESVKAPNYFKTSTASRFENNRSNKNVVKNNIFINTTETSANRNFADLYFPMPSPNKNNSLKMDLDLNTINAAASTTPKTTTIPSINKTGTNFVQVSPDNTSSLAAELNVECNYKKLDEEE